MQVEQVEQVCLYSKEITSEDTLKQICCFLIQENYCNAIAPHLILSLMFCSHSHHVKSNVLITSNTL